MARTTYSVAVDHSALRAYAGYYLAVSLLKKSLVTPSSIVVQFLVGVSESVISPFRRLGLSICRTPHVSRLAQMDQLSWNETDRLVLLEPNTLFLQTIEPELAGDTIVVGLAKAKGMKQNSLKMILAGLGRSGSQFRSSADAFSDPHYGFFGLPKSSLKELIPLWKKQALRLREQGKTSLKDLDFTAFFLALHEGEIEFSERSSNSNFPIFGDPDALQFEPEKPISALRYPSTSLNLVGILDGPDRCLVGAAATQANDLIRENYDNHLFWNFRYENFPERGSGLGSRGEAAVYKRDLLVSQGIEGAASILDFGCGDLEVLKPLNLVGYLGLDQSEAALDKARAARPDWQFRQFTATDDPQSLPVCQIVVCLEVLIHQTREEDYRRIVDILSSRCGKTLFVSGYEDSASLISTNHMLAFYEPLSESLRKTGRFETIRMIGSHSECVSIFRCERPGDRPGLSAEN